MANDIIPLVRRRNRPPRAGEQVFAIPQHTPGRRHVVEGAQTTVPDTEATRGKGLLGFITRMGYAGSDRETNPLIDAYQTQQEARSRIRPIADPEEGETTRRRRAARRRMRGRLGTMLSERETLG